MAALNVPQYETLYFDVVTHNPKTGAVADADSAVWEMFAEGVDSVLCSFDLTKRSGRVGHYCGSIWLHPAYGFLPGCVYNLVATATVDGVTARTVVMTFRVLAQETTDGKPAVDNEAIADTVLSRDVAGVEATAPEHSLCTIVLASLESAVSSTQWTIKRSDGTTPHVTKTVTVDSDADPITGVS